MARFAQDIGYVHVWGNGEQYVSRWSWTSTCPFAVTVEFGPGRLWSLSRDVLAVGLHEPTGDGDVRISPAGRSVLVALSSPSGRAVLRFSRPWLVTFLQVTDRLVPPNREREFFDVDAELALLGVRS